ncbi:cupin domain-containing protein [Nevskia sp.]|uniref:cupin domain-containing protein n=1 Tax=Nevskia sp. TaxID=1929292 RepID=UPI0025E603C6|nr:cupin domain-containing protein [Nevskia sp.]
MAAAMKADALIARLGLERHPEGGWFRRIHTADAIVDTAHGPRARVTSIHYLLTTEEPRGRLHRNRSDILHYLQGGGPVEYLLLEDSGELRRVVLGSEPSQALFLHVPGGVWKASQLIDGASHALVSEAVVPGFDFADHSFADQRLLDEHPEHRALLSPLVRL